LLFHGQALKLPIIKSKEDFSFNGGNKQVKYYTHIHSFAGIAYAIQQQD